MYEIHLCNLTDIYEKNVCPSAVDVSVRMPFLMQCNKCRISACYLASSLHCFSWRWAVLGPGIKMEMIFCWLKSETSLLWWKKLMYLAVCYSLLFVENTKCLLAAAAQKKWVITRYCNVYLCCSLQSVCYKREYFSNQLVQLYLWPTFSILNMGCHW